ncbi:MAG: hypothetical protein KatS3mg131_3950 [Candidatus Tectimicrobiota bacterium]|nr:MAG: hypothetical protein KatS3mg131_3950 [Candidatus Tectomicrobia bacterium]
MALKRLPIDFAAFAEAMRNQGRNEYDYYLDTATGRVMRISTEVLEALEEGRTIAGSLTAWQQEQLREAREVMGDTVGRYLLIPERPAWRVEELMADFADGVTDAALREKLRSALDARDAARRFREILAQYPEEQKRWQALQAQSDQEYATEWLKEEGIEPQWTTPAPREASA